MLIRDMRREAAEAMLARVRMGHIACTEGLQPYVTPFSFGYDGTYIYSFATVGRKITALRANPQVCVTALEMINFQDWKSVVVFGQYQELPDTKEFFNAGATAHWLLSEHAVWWEPGYVRTLHDGAERPMIGVWFRILIHSITGHEAVLDTLPLIPESLSFKLGRCLGRLIGWRLRRSADGRRGATKAIT